jgi:hypothetical protein
LSPTNQVAFLSARAKNFASWKTGDEAGPLLETSSLIVFLGSECLSGTFAALSYWCCYPLPARATHWNLYVHLIFVHTGLGGGFNERQNVEYIERPDSDDEYDEVAELRMRSNLDEKIIVLIISFILKE